MKTLLGLLFDVFDDIADTLKFLSVFVWNFDVEFFFKSHHELDGIERIRTEIFDEGSRGNDLLWIDAELLDDDVFYFFFD